MHGAVAAGTLAGGYRDIFAAAEKMGGLKETVYKPIPENVKLYDLLYADYQRLYEYFGRGANDVMKRLKAFKRAWVTGSRIVLPTDRGTARKAKRSARKPAKKTAKRKKKR
jgi:hypothetical protein